MMRKLCSVLLAITMVFWAVPSNAAGSSTIDLSRIKFSSGSEPLVFKFGNVSIDGEVRQVFPFTEAEVQKLVKETLRSKGLTELDIKEYNDLVEKARRATEFTKEDIEKAKEAITRSVSVVPATSASSDFVKLILNFMTSSSWDDIGAAAIEYADSKKSGWIDETTTGFIKETGLLGKNVDKGKEWLDKYLSILSFCDGMTDHHLRTKQKWKDIANGAEAKRSLNEFYNALQKRVDAYKHKSDKSGWVISFDNAMAGRNFTFFGVDSNFQIWYLDMLLNQKTTNKLGSAVGFYEGFFSITAINDMEGFTSRANEAIRNMKGFSAGIQKAESMHDVKLKLSTVSSGTAKIHRTISGDCEATIDEMGKITLSMHEKKDDTTVKIAGLTVKMDYTLGKKKVAEGYGELTFSISADKEDLRVKSTTGNVGVVIGQNNGFSKFFSISGDHSVGWDKGIWKPWDGTKKTLEYSGR